MARRFQFRLETVLDVRRLREREAQRVVALRRLELARADKLNAETVAAITQQQSALREAQQSGVLEPAALAQGRAWIAHLRGTLLQRQAQRAELNARLAAALDALRAARVQTKTIEKLRERRLSEYQRATNLREQAAMDEVARQLHMNCGAGA